MCIRVKSDFFIKICTVKTCTVILKSLNYKENVCELSSDDNFVLIFLKRFQGVSNLGCIIIFMITSQLHPDCTLIHSAGLHDKRKPYCWKHNSIYNRRRQIYSHAVGRHPWHNMAAVMMSSCAILLFTIFSFTNALMPFPKPSQLRNDPYCVPYGKSPHFHEFKKYFIDLYIRIPNLSFVLNQFITSSTNVQIKRYSKVQSKYCRFYKIVKFYIFRNNKYLWLLNQNSNGIIQIMADIFILDRILFPIIFVRRWEKFLKLNNIENFEFFASFY